jgi:hypothetical protein
MYASPKALYLGRNLGFLFLGQFGCGGLARGQKGKKMSQQVRVGAYNLFEGVTALSELR